MNHQTVLHSCHTSYMCTSSTQEFIFSTSSPPPVFCFCCCFSSIVILVQVKPSGGNSCLRICLAMPFSVYRRILFYCAQLHCVLQILGFCVVVFLFTTQMFVLTLHQGNLLAPFFQQHLIIPDSVSCFGNSSSISHFFLLLYLLWLSEVSNL